MQRPRARPAGRHSLHPRHLVAQRRVVRAERLILLEQLPARAVERADRDRRVVGTLGEFGGLRAEKRAERAEERRDAPLEGRKLGGRARRLDPRL